MTTQTTRKVSKLPVWAVGHDGEFDWQLVRAEDELSAKLSWIDKHSFDDDVPPDSITAIAA